MGVVCKRWGGRSNQGVAIGPSVSSSRFPVGEGGGGLLEFRHWLLMQRRILRVERSEPVFGDNRGQRAFRMR